MKKAIEVFYSQARKGTDPGNDEFFKILEHAGAEGKFAKLALLSQRAHERTKKFYQNEVQDPEFERKVLWLNHKYIGELTEHALEHQQALCMRYKRFKYMARMTTRHNGPALRFSERDGLWIGDDRNLQPICDYCDAVIARWLEAHPQVEDDAGTDRARKILSWPTAQ